MKKVYSIIAFWSIALIFNAQKPIWVDKESQNRKVVLEEYTGIYCGFCPDGHRMANELKAANEGNVFLINIHAGGYATPQKSSDVDLRTTDGNALASASGLEGYPAGSVNRNKTPWASSRSKWESEARSIMDSLSPVNVHVKSTYNSETKELITVVEGYYTGDSKLSTNRINVWLTQDSILGGQSGGTNYYPTNFKDGKYIHNHVFRMRLNKNLWGDTIVNTKEGAYFYRIYKNSLPSKIGNIDIDVNQLNAVAFVSETQNRILNGNATKVTTDEDILFVFKAFANLDSFSKKIHKVSQEKEIEATVEARLTLSKDTVYVWSVDSVNVPYYWKMVNICDNSECYDYPATKTKEMIAKGNATLDFLKPGIEHNKRVGYGYVIVSLWKKSNKTSTIKSYKLSLITTEAASVTLVTDAQEKVLHYFDHKLYVDTEFKSSTIEIVDLSGKSMSKQIISNPILDVNNLSKGIYLARVLDSKSGQIVKTLKFNVE